MQREENKARDGQAGKFVRKDRRKKNINSRDDLQKRGEERAKRKLEQSTNKMERIKNKIEEEEKSEEYRGNTIKQGQLKK